MDPVSHPYYKHGKTFLSIISLWPCDKRWTKQILRTCICILLISGTVFQLTPCVTSKCNGELLLKLLPYVIGSLIFFLKYVSICFKVELIIYVFEQMEQNWHTLKDEQEIKILQKYSELSRQFSLAFATLMYAPLMAFVCHQFLPDVLDVLSPLNESRPHKIPVLFEYFIDQEKYFYFLIMHANLMVFMGTTAIIANETMTILILYHICGLFKVASYRLKFIFNQNFMSRSIVPTEQYTTQDRVIDAIKTHRSAIQFGQTYFKNQSTAYLLLLSLGIISITLCLYRIQQALSLMNDMPELFSAVCHLIANMIYLFITNFLGQAVIDHSSKMFIDIYSTPWYAASLPVQHILLFAMQKNITGWSISVGSVFVPCFEGFAMIIRMAMSYFMALRSIQA